MVGSLLLSPADSSSLPSLRPVQQLTAQAQACGGHRTCIFFCPFAAAQRGRASSAVALPAGGQFSRRALAAGHLQRGAPPVAQCPDTAPACPHCGPDQLWWACGSSCACARPKSGCSEVHGWLSCGAACRAPPHARKLPHPGSLPPTARCSPCWSLASSQRRHSGSCGEAALGSCLGCLGDPARLSALLPAGWPPIHSGCAPHGACHKWPGAPLLVSDFA